MDHSKQQEVEKLIEHNIPVLLEGPTGTGKTTILQKAAKKAGVPYSFIAGTRQTTVSNILGFMSVNGTYVPSVFRKAYEEGHYFNIDEIDAMDPNALLVFNSLENNLIAFPDGYLEPPHKNFRLCATANPADAHDRHTGRAVLDAATLDRFDIIKLDVDPELEKEILEERTFLMLQAIRLTLNECNIKKHVSLRDGLRLEKRMNLGFCIKYVEERILENNHEIIHVYKKHQPVRRLTQDTVRTVKELLDIVEIRPPELPEEEKDILRNKPPGANGKDKWRIDSWNPVVDEVPLPQGIPKTGDTK